MKKGLTSVYVEHTRLEWSIYRVRVMLSVVLIIPVLHLPLLLTQL